MMKSVAGRFTVQTKLEQIFAEDPEIFLQKQGYTFWYLWLD